MKKMLCLLAALLLCAFPALAEEEPALTPAPAMEAPVDVPLEEGEGNTGDVFGYDGYASDVTLTYESLTNKTFNIVLDHPVGWTQIPGRYTLCFEANRTGDLLPARMTLTRKYSSRDLTDSRITKEFKSLLKVLSEQYDSFELGEPNKETSFMGKMGYSIQYSAESAASGKVRGYVIAAAMDAHYMFAFHFRCADSEYAAYTNAIVHLRESVQSLGK